MVHIPASVCPSVRPSVRPSVNTHIFFSETKRRKFTGFVLLERPRSPHVKLFMRRCYLLGLVVKLRTSGERSYKIEVHLLYIKVIDVMQHLGMPAWVL